MRIELQNAQASLDSAQFNQQDADEIAAMSGIHKLDPTQRGNVRRIVKVLLDLPEEKNCDCQEGECECQ